MGYGRTLHSFALITFLGLWGCGHGGYASEAETAQVHGQRFHAYLTRELVEAAVHENQAIELLGARLKANAQPATDSRAVRDLEAQTALIERLREQAAQNWFSLAQYFSTHHRFAQARAVYHRIVDTYSKGAERLYADYALTALRDLDILTLDGTGDDVRGQPASLSARQQDAAPR
ncbi:hypothetical protein [Candidatus Nitrospira bockiana]